MRPVLEQLESRIVPSAVNIFDHGGHALSAPAVDNVYIGPAAAQQTAFDILTHTLVGPYAQVMSAAYGVGQGTLRTSLALPTVTATTNEQVQQVLQALIANGTLPPPTAQTVEMVYLPAKPTDAFAVNDAAYHSAFFLPNGQEVPYAVTWPLTVGVQTDAVAHEFAESVTDAVFNGWYGADYTQEVCDVLGGQNWQLNGFTVATIAGPNGQPIPGQVDGIRPAPPPLPPVPPPPPVAPPVSPPVASPVQTWLDVWSGFVTRLESLFTDLVTFRFQPNWSSLSMFWSNWSSWGV